MPKEHTTKFYLTKPYARTSIHSGSRISGDSRTMRSFCQDEHFQSVDCPVVGCSESAYTRADRVGDGGREASSGSGGRAPAGPL